MSPVVRCPKAIAEKQRIRDKANETNLKFLLISLTPRESLLIMFWLKWLLAIPRAIPKTFLNLMMQLISQRRTCLFIKAKYLKEKVS
jgi:hypothetical protein